MVVAAIAPRVCVCVCVFSMDSTSTCLPACLLAYLLALLFTFKKKNRL